MRVVNKELVESMREHACMACGRSDIDITGHHVKSKGSGGPDEGWNLMPLCFKHHVDVHAYGLSKFAERHKAVMTWLQLWGWEFNGRKWVRF